MLLQLLDCLGSLIKCNTYNNNLFFLLQKDNLYLHLGKVGIKISNLVRLEKKKNQSHQKTLLDYI
jgi:hypothetical protein